MKKMSSKIIYICLLMIVFLELIVAPPVDQKKKESEDKNEKPEEELDDFGLEYGRYLQQVVQALEEDKEFAKKLENLTTEEIKNGRIAKELEFVKHNIRSRLDELKRIEIDRLRKLLQQQMEQTELGLYRNEEGHLLNSPDGRRWRTIPNHRRGFEGGVGDGNFWLGLNRQNVKIPKHLDIDNPHSFEIEDLKKLILTATSDLEALDKQRREEFKKYELEKEAKYRESLKNMTEEERKLAEKQHQEMVQKHKDHPKVHHPGSKPQLEQVWEDQDHMPKEEFNPRTFFAMHDVNGDGHLDVEEVEAILIPEVKKMYNPNNAEDDPAEMEEEFHRMREHIFNETDNNKDGLISLEEFLKMTQQQEFQQDEGWKGLDEQQIYSEAELEEYIRQRQMEMHQPGYQQYPYADPRGYYDVGNAQQHGLPPQINYQVPPAGIHHQQGYPQGQQYGVPPGNYPPHQMHAGQPQQYQGGPPHTQFQAGQHPQQYQQNPQQFQGIPQHAQAQFQGAHQQQQQYQGVQQQQQYQSGTPQQKNVQAGQYPGQPQQQFQDLPQHQPNTDSQQFQIRNSNEQVNHAQQASQQFVSPQPPQKQPSEKAAVNNQISINSGKPNVGQESALNSPVQHASSNKQP